MKICVARSTLKGRIRVPPSKSHTLRAILFASLATGNSKIFNCLNSPDTNRMIKACQAIGADIYQKQGALVIHGTAGKPKLPAEVIDAGNSGQVLRFIGAILGLIDGCSVITGDYSIQFNRPAQPLLDGLTQLGAFAVSDKNNGHAPLIIKGRIKAGKTTISGEDSQPVSALIIAACFLDGNTELIVKNPGEKPWVALTLSWLERLKIKYENDNFKRYIIYGNNSYLGFEYTVPSDFTSAIYPITAALITNSNVTLEQIDMSDSQGDKKFIVLLREMGAYFEYDNVKKDLYVHGQSSLTGKRINVNDLIDTITVWAVAGCFAKGEIEISGGTISRKKECDRIAAICSELKKMGAHIQEKEDGFIISPSHLTGTMVNSFNDHRMALSLAVAGMNATGNTIIDNADCIDKSFPGFVNIMQQAGVNITNDHNTFMK
jgi:3-phosphoshikimate 1-carboxyvinyltransferase